MSSGGGTPGIRSDFVGIYERLPDCPRSTQSWRRPSASCDTSRIGYDKPPLKRVLVPCVGALAVVPPHRMRAKARLTDPRDDRTPRRSPQSPCVLGRRCGRMRGAYRTMGLRGLPHRCESHLSALLCARPLPLEGFLFTTGESGPRLAETLCPRPSGVDLATSFTSVRASCLFLERIPISRGVGLA